MKFSVKMIFMIILKVTKDQGFTLSLEDTFFKKPQGGGGQIDPSSSLSPAVLGLRLNTKLQIMPYMHTECMLFPQT